MTSPSVTTLLLIRHAQPAAWAKQICHGALDVPLSDEGLIQARRIGKHLQDTRFDAVYSSPLSRAVATARAVTATRDAGPVLREELAEIDFGAFEGKSFDEIAASHPDLYAGWMREPTSVRFPGGERWDDLQTRALDGFRRIRRDHPGGSVAVVTHGGVLRALLSDVLGVGDRMVFRIGQSWGAMSLVDWVGDEPIVRYMNVAV